MVVMGGLGPGDVTTDRVVAVDAASFRVVAQGRLQQGVHDAAGAFVGGRAVVFGGGAATESAAVQSWAAGTTRVLGRLPQPRSDSAAVNVGGTAYVVGGFDGSGLVRDIVATRDGRRFRVAGRLRAGVRYPAVAELAGRIYVIGGQLATTVGTSTGAQSDLVQRFDPRTGRTTVVGRLPRTLGHAMAFVLGGSLYVAGGRHRTTASARIWRLAVGTGGVRVHAAGRLPRAISDAGTVVVGHRVLLVGGETTGPLAPQSTIIAVRLQ